VFGVQGSVEGQFEKHLPRSVPCSVWEWLSAAMFFLWGRLSSRDDRGGTPRPYDSGKLELAGRYLPRTGRRRLGAMLSYPRHSWASFSLRYSDLEGQVRGVSALRAPS
jgi:hypothetical protein